MKWDDTGVWGSARTERPLAELTNRLPCDFLVANDGGLDPARILLPTAGGPDSDLNAEVARALQQTANAQVELLHVVGDGTDKRAGEAFLRKWAADHGLEDVSIVVESEDIEAAIRRQAADSTMLLLGATEQGLLSRLIHDSLHLEVATEVTCSVLLAERPSERSIRERLLGSRTRRRRPALAFQDRIQAGNQDPGSGTDPAGAGGTADAGEE